MLLSNEERLKQIADNSSIIISLKDLDGKYIHVNPAFEKFFGTTLKAVRGRTAAECFSEEVGQQVNIKDDEVRSKEAIIEKEVGFSVNGKLIFHQLFSFPFYNESGRVAGIFTFAHELTSIRQKEYYLEEANRFLDAILENIPNMIFVKDAAELRFVRFNKAGEELLGYPRNELIGKNDYDFFSKEEADFFTGKDREVLAENKLLDIKEEPIATRNKGSRWLHTKKIPVTGKQGEPVYLLGISEDITEKKYADDKIRELNAELESRVKERTEELVKINRQLEQEIIERAALNEALAKSEANYRLLIDTMKEGLLFVDRGDRVLFVNRQFCLLTGYDEQELLGNIYHEILLERNYAEQIKRKRAAGESMLTGEYELEISRKDGKRILVNVNASPVTNREGIIIGYVATHLDITAYKLSETAKEKMTADLIQQNKDLQQFAYVTSHNLRAPLANLIGFIDLYDRQNPLDPVNATVIDNVSHSAFQLDETIRDLNDILTIRNNLSQIEEEIDLGKAVDEIAASVHREMETAEAALHCDFSAVRAVYSVKGFVYSILQNLINNAIKYKSPDRKPHITVRSFREAGFTGIEVTDNGLGIDLEKYGEQLFGLYKRFHRNVEGKGLGLYLVKCQAEALGGRVEVVSAPDAGSTFTVFLKNKMDG